MKKLCLLLSVLLIITPVLYSCKQEKDTTSEIKNVIAGFKDFYSVRQLVCWQDISAVYLAQHKISDYNYKSALSEPKTLTEKAGFVISVSLLKKQNIDTSAYKTDDYITEIRNAAEKDFEKLTTKELAVCFYSLTASGTKFDFEPAVKYIEKRQNKDGGFSVKEGTALSDAESSAYVLNIIMMARSSFSDTCYDGILVYLGNAINEKNTVSDSEGKESSIATALTLNSLIAAKIPLNGEISTALTTALNTNFKFEVDSAFMGYKKYAKDSNVSREATGEVFLCFASTAYGNLWVNLSQVNEMFKTEASATTVSDFSTDESLTDVSGENSSDIF